MSFSFSIDILGGICDFDFFFFFFSLKVFGELLVDSQQLLMVTVATALLEIGYDVQVLRLLCSLYLYWKSTFEFRERKMNRELALKFRYFVYDMHKCVGMP